MNDSSDMRRVIEPRSDQWNADDFLSGQRTFTIRDVQIRGGQEQPVNILLNGTDKVYRPCKSMSRCLVHAWGPDAAKYIGRSLTLYQDPTVKWGGMAVGGIRISHLSHIERDMVLALTETKGKKKPFIVKPLAMTEQKKPETKPATNQTPPETIEFKDWEGNPHSFARTIAGMEAYTAAFAQAYAGAIDKAAWFADNAAEFHKLAMGAVENRGKSARMEKLAAAFDAIAETVRQNEEEPA